MSGFPEKLRLKGMAEEDLYFAKRDRELIAAIQQRAELQKRRDASPKETSSVAATAEDPASSLTRDPGQ